MAGNALDNGNVVMETSANRRRSGDVVVANKRRSGDVVVANRRENAQSSHAACLLNFASARAMLTNCFSDTRFPVVVSRRITSEVTSLRASKPRPVKSVVAAAVPAAHAQHNHILATHPA